MRNVKKSRVTIVDVLVGMAVLLQIGPAASRPYLDLAVLAIELSQAMEWIAGEHVALARELDGVTWEDVGEAFGISMQSAHHRFRDRL